MLSTRLYSSYSWWFGTEKIFDVKNCETPDLFKKLWKPLVLRQHRTLQQNPKVEEEIFSVFVRIRGHLNVTTGKRPPKRLLKRAGKVKEDIFCPWSLLNSSSHRKVFVVIGCQLYSFAEKLKRTFRFDGVLAQLPLSERKRFPTATNFQHLNCVHPGRVTPSPSKVIFNNKRKRKWPTLHRIK